MAEQVLAAGWVDLVGMTRAMIADPHLPHKAQGGAADRHSPLCRREYVH